MLSTKYLINTQIIKYGVYIMNDYKRIFIVGQLGAGKALFAKTLAEKLGWGFIDTDLGLERRVGRTVTEIMGSAGVTKFHACQANIISSLLSKENIVVTTDASIVEHEEICRFISNDLVIFLHVNLSIQLERMTQGPSPLLKTKPNNFLEKLHAERDELYEQMANITIDSSDNALEKHVQTVIDLFLQNKDIEQHATKISLEAKDLAFFHKQTHQLVSLTEQQARCLKLLAQGKSSKEIARDLYLSHRTVDWNFAKIMEILGCSSSKELIVLYHQKP
jgi:shikimate kinase